MDNLNTVSGKKGGPKAEKPYIPREDANNLQATTTANIIDLLCEGEISGPAIEDDWYKSTFLNEIPIMSTEDSWNFNGITLDARVGSSSQEYIQNDGVETEYSVNVQITEAGGAIARTITDTDVDHAKVAISIPYLMNQSDKGDLIKTSVQIQITITPDGGMEQTAVAYDGAGTINGKCTSEYRKQYTIKNLADYGSGPWVIKVYRITEDSGSAKLVNDTYFYSYTEIIDTKLNYADRAMMDLVISAKEFDENIPDRAYKVKGRLIKYPANYNTSTREYVGTWDGVFTTGYTNNPAWVVYDLLTDPLAGVGDFITEAMVNKWELYTIGKYCDEWINYESVQKNNDGSYTTTSGVEPRYTFNGVIETREQALMVLTHLCSVFSGFPIWTSGYVSFVQDRPTDVTRIASPSNIHTQGFEYEGTPKRVRHTIARVSWNNPDKFGELDVLEIVDEDGLRDFGYNPVDIAAFGCTSRSEAHRRGKMLLDTDLNGTETVKFRGGFEWADCIPGEIIAVQDPDYASTILEGRIASSTSTSITLDKNITLAAGVTYTLQVQQAATSIVEKVLTNTPATTKVLTWSGAITAPPVEGLAIISASNLATRQFRVLQIGETAEGWEIQAAYYDSTKYDRVEKENNLEVEAPPTIAIPVGKLSAPTNITAEAFSYTSGDSDNRYYGIQIGWIHSTDPRTDDYELRARLGEGPYIKIGTNVEPEFSWRGVDAGTYDIGVRGRGIAGQSEWLTYSDFTLITTVSGLAAPTGLDTVDGGGSWSGPDCGITWTTSSGHLYEDDSIGDSNIKNYKVEVRKADTTLLRTYFTASKNENYYIYTKAMNGDDNSGAPLRNLLFYVYTVDIYDTVSTNYASVAASNPAPDMSAGTPTVTAKPSFLKIEWTSVTDNDMSHYKIYCDENNPPTTHVATVAHPGTLYEEHDVSYGTNYYVQLEPYDGFGAGTKSSIPDAESPLIIPGTDVDAEVSDIYVITDSDGNSSASLEALKDNVFGAGGVAYSVSGSDKYIQYYTGLNNYWDRWVISCSNANARVYVGVSSDGSTWTYYKNSGGDFIVATNQADAQSNYLSLDAGTNYALMPNNVYGNYIRLYLTGTWSTTLYEAVPSNIGIFKLAAIESLSAITANIGTITAGNLQSDNYADDEGMNIDLDSKVIYIGGSSTPVFSYDDATKTLECVGTFEFSSGSSGYANISDAPVGVEDYATDNSNWEHPSDTTKIDGGDIYVGSSITLEEGGSAVFGDSNVIIDTTGNHGSIVVAEDGGPAAHSYCELTDGDIQFEYWTGTTHKTYKSLTRIEQGTASNNTIVSIPGIFKSNPVVMVSPQSIRTYDRTYANQNQTLKCSVENLEKYNANGYWRFRALAQLELSPNEILNIPVNLSASTGYTHTVLLQTGAKTGFVANTRRLVANVNIEVGYYGSIKSTIGGLTQKYYNVNGIMRLYYYTSSGWSYVENNYNNLRTYVGTIDTGTISLDITQAYLWFQATSVGTQATTGKRVTYADYYLGSITFTSVDSYQSSASVIQNGTLNWIATGQ